MNHINACFISYRHTDAASHQFVQAFVKQLEKQLHLWLPNANVFFDKDGLQVGDLFNEKLADELCRSACMVMFFLPLHFDCNHPYCAMEYKAMLELEKNRLGQSVDDLRNKGLIFPVVYRGADYLPAEIKDHRQYEDFQHLIVEADFERPDCHARLMKLSEAIFNRYTALTKSGVIKSDECKLFRFPSKDEIKDWLEEVSPIQTFTMPGH